jgi:hypothetical protein
VATIDAMSATDGVLDASAATTQPQPRRPARSSMAPEASGSRSSSGDGSPDAMNADQK